MIRKAATPRVISESGLIFSSHTASRSFNTVAASLFFVPFGRPAAPIVFPFSKYLVGISAPLSWPRYRLPRYHAPAGPIASEYSRPGCRLGPWDGVLPQASPMHDRVRDREPSAPRSVPRPASQTAPQRLRRSVRRNLE